MKSSYFLTATLVLTGCANSTGTSARVAAPMFEAPASVLLYGGTSAGVDQHLKDAEAVYLAVIGEPIELAPIVHTSLQDMLGLDGVEGIDFSRPFRFAVLDDTVYGKASPVVLVFGANQALLEPKFSEAIKTETSLKHTLPSGEVAHLAFTEDLAVVSLCGPEALSKHTPFMIQLMGQTLQPGASLVFEMEHLTRTHGEEMKEAVAAAKQEGLRQFSAAPNLAPSQVKAMGAAYDLFSTAIDEGEQSKMRFDFDADGVSFDFDVTYKQGSPTQELLAPVKPVPFPSADRLPVGAVWSLGGMDREASEALLAALEPWFIQFTGMESTEKGSIFRDLAGDEFAMTLSALPDGKLAFLMQNEFNDSKRAQASYDFASSIYENSKYRETLAATGVSFNFQKDSYRIKGQPVSEVQMTSTLDPTDPQAQITAAMMGLMGKIQYVVSGSSMVFAYGPDGKEVLERFGRSEIPGGLLSDPGVQTVLKQAAPAALAIFYVDAIGIAGLIPQARAEPFASMIRSLGKSAHLHYSLGVPNGRVHFKVYVSNSLNRAVSMAAKLFAMRQNLPQ